MGAWSSPVIVVVLPFLASIVKPVPVMLAACATVVVKYTQVGFEGDVVDSE